MSACESNLEVKRLLQIGATEKKIQLLYQVHSLKAIGPLFDDMVTDMVQVIKVSKALLPSWQRVL